MDIGQKKSSKWLVFRRYGLLSDGKAEEENVRLPVLRKNPALVPSGSKEERTTVGLTELPNQQHGSPRRKNPRRTTSQPRSELLGDGKQFVTLSTPNIPNLPPVRGKKGSQFVTFNHGVILRPAMFSFECSEDINRFLRACMVASSPFHKIDRYFGMRYPDGTSLSYVPIERTWIEYNESPNSSPKLVVYVENAALLSICENTKNLVGDRHATYPAPGRIDQETALEWRSPHKNLLWTLSGGEYYSKKVDDVIEQHRKIQGIGCFVVRYRRHDLCTNGEIFFEFHSMIVKSDVEAIFGPFKEYSVEI